MKIEKINDNQIRCTLTKEDLEQRQLKVSELAYGTEKAKALFREMLRWAEYKYNFQSDDIPLMIEAVPISNDSIVLIVTKVEYPEELDTRFSRFTEDLDNDEDFEDELMDFDDINEELSSANIEPIAKPSSAADIIDLFNKAKEVSNALKSATPDNTSQEIEIPIDLTKLFVFNSLDEIIELSKILGEYYHGENALYKNNSDNKYYLIISKSSHSPEEFNKVCNIITEYGIQENLSIGSDAYFTEHFSPIILKNALSTLKHL